MGALKLAQDNISGTFRTCQRGGFWHFLRGFQTFGLLRQNFVPWGGGMCILFEICEKRPFHKFMGWGGGGARRSHF